MRTRIILWTILLAGCTPTSNKPGLFNHLADKKTVVIYLNRYKVDSVPADIGALTNANLLFIGKDSVAGWTLYPPLSAMDQRAQIPPFRKLPDEITRLVNLRNLALVDLDLTELPENFGNLKNLDTLSLTLNKLTISKELEKLKQLKNLKYLILVGNQVDSTDVYELKKVNPTLVLDIGPWSKP